MSVSKPASKPEFIIIPENDPDYYYEAREKLGTGQFSTVWKCTTRKGDEVAVKLNDRNSNKQSVEKEARRHRRITTANVPHTPQYIDWFSTTISGSKKVDVIVTELFRCKDAFDTFCTQNGKTFRHKHAISMGVQCLETLDCLHEMLGIAHRDVKPENMLLDENFNTRVFDFGNAKTIKKMAKDDYRGTYSFWSPELMLRSSYGEKIDESSDLWALGASLVMLYIKTHFICIPIGDKQTRVNDYLHQMTLHFGMPSSKFIESLSEDDKRWFIKYRNSSYSMSTYASTPIESQIRFLNSPTTKKYPPEMPFWKIRIYEAASKKGDTEEQAQEIIELLEPMFNYQNRLNALTQSEEDYKGYKTTAAKCLAVARPILARLEAAPAVKMHVAEPDGTLESKKD